MTALLVGLSTTRARASSRASAMPDRRSATCAWSPRCPSPRASSTPKTRPDCRFPSRSTPRRPLRKRSRGKEDDERFPLLSFANTDMAFSGDLLAVGNYHGFNLYHLAGDGKPQADQLGHLPRRAGRSVDRRQPPDHVGRADPRPRRLRATRRAHGHQSGALPRHPHLRHLGPRPADPGRPGADLPRLAHPLGACPGQGGPARSSSMSRHLRVRKGEELAGCVGERPATPAPPCSASTWWKSPSPIPAAPGSSTARRSSPIPRRAASRACGAAALMAKAPRKPTDGPVPRHHRLPEPPLAAGACSGNGIIFDIADPRKPHRIDAVSDPNFSYWHSATFNKTAPRCCSPTNGAAAGGRAAGPGPAQLGRRRHLRHRRTASCSSAATTRSGGPGRAGELRRAQRLDHPGPGPRYLRPGLVSGRHLGDGLHRFRESERDRLSSIAGRSAADQLVLGGYLVGLLVPRPHLRDRDRPRAGRLRADPEPR